MKKLFLLLFVLPLPSQAQDSIEDDWFVPVFAPGKYDCQILSEARMSSTHLENDPGGKAVSSNEPGFWFGLEIVHAGPRDFFAKEIKTNRTPVNITELEEGVFPSVLMGDYAYSGIEFEASERPDFLRLFKTGKTKKFWQAGYLYPGGVDVHFVIRAGNCYPRNHIPNTSR